MESNVTSDEILLEEANKEKVLVLLPVIITVFVIMILGTLGNSLVCYVYYFRMRKTPSHYFVLFLAVLDLVSCCIGMPAELGDLFLPNQFNSPFACKFLRFVLSFTIISSCITLICVAFDRYYKVCKPLKGFPIRKVQILCGVAIAIGALLSWPALAIFGIKTVETTHPGLYGTECSTSDDMGGTVFPLIYYVTLITAFVVTFAIFTTLYVRIGMEINRRKNNPIGERGPPVSRETLRRRELTTSILSDEESTSAEPCSDEETTRDLRANRSSFSHLRDYIVHHFRSDVNNDLKSSDHQIDSNITSAIPERRKKKSMYRSVRTTYIFLAVFIAFLISFLPYLIVNILKHTKTVLHEFNSDTEEVVYNLCVRSFFISNFINPIIYSLLNKKFQKECKTLFKRYCCRCCVRRQMSAVTNRR
ncbi:neuromedin-U receptor 1-like [Mizuhopecten yessoensis]|uniref:Orexin receptor type 2 n=1 Tax=Mizuhopecten yessoensis TaxID=6573 RepID=A0A210QCI2_MIZYE|nr:neuromedin-U receptor 1-like [Mizuhopecten yessoensis]XP_021361765.1 neuromedin-U receptor 1-like [Mizuhopecten yessoensis]XP_021361766.1 neuromedin-U receptor 1-like [Mizuhopecten yessoensis]XP_021361767.1 neuromedin-U receptor 1-like [Mizuhopecten yessoensis]XP_021361768.1 neuromedin-U receptor 1-like [Mizuhopecten yessoensis]OWF46442.1 Orexin receptor type 2 [Mizuhopecten yessoensis]